MQVKKSHKKKVRRPKWPKPPPERAQTAHRPEPGNRSPISSRAKPHQVAPSPHPRDDQRRQSGHRGQRPADLRETLKGLQKERMSSVSSDTLSARRSPAGEAPAPRASKTSPHPQLDQRAQASRRPRKSQRPQSGLRPQVARSTNQKKLKTLDRVI